MSSPLPPLPLLATRVLGVLAEKQHTVPDTYPLTLNALVAGCNQKTSRDPILSATDSDVQSTLDELKGLDLIVESSGGRVMRYAHNVERVLRVPSQSVALLATMMLRGPQTIGELRINSDRLHPFADVSAVDAFLRELESRAEGALVVELARRPGERETRWTHLLGGQPAAAEPSHGTKPPSAFAYQGSSSGIVSEVASELGLLRAEIDRMQSEIDLLKSDVRDLRNVLQSGRS